VDGRARTERIIDSSSTERTGPFPEVTGQGQDDSGLLEDTSPRSQKVDIFIFV